MNEGMWRDVTSRSQGDTDRTPRSVEIRIGALKLVVTRHIDHPKDAWVMYCEPLFGHVVCEGKDIDTAKREALSRLCAELSAALEIATFRRDGKVGR